MKTSASTHVPSASPNESVTRVRRFRALAGVAAFALALGTIAVASAGVAPEADAEPVVITSPSAGEFFGGSAVRVSGTRTPGGEVQVSLEDGDDPLCIVSAGDEPAWSCSIDLVDGPHTLTAVERMPDGTTTSGSVSIAVLGPPTIGVDDSGTAVSNGSVRGTAYPGASVTATVSDGSGCTFTADSSGSWFCVIDGTLPSGSYSVTATQTASFTGGRSSDPSEPVTLDVDSDAPTAPTLTEPAAGSRQPLSGVRYSGEGEDGATATVFADAFSVCDAVVADGRWTCIGDELPAGSYRVAVIQSDAAGNVSPPSASITVEYAPSGTGSPTPTAPPSTDPGTPTPTPTPTSPGATAPSTPGTPGASTPGTSTPGATAPPSGTTSPPGSGSTAAPSDPNGSSGGDASAPPGGTDPTEESTPPPSADGGGPTPPDGPGGGSASPGSPGTGWNTLHDGSWSAVTPMTTSLAAAESSTGVPVWVHSVGLALASLALVVIPARLVVGAGTTRRRRPWRLAGRNRASVEYETAPQIRPVGERVVSAGLIAATAGLVVLSSAVDSQPAYIRLFVAVLVAVVIVNAVAALVPAVVARRLLGVAPAVIPAPRALVFVAVAALGSRVVGLEPALLFGIVLGLGLPPATDAAVRARLAAVRIASLIVLGGASWAVTSAVPPSSSVLSVFVVEVTSATTLMSVGSAAILLFPVGRPAGTAILRRSPFVWAMMSVVVYTALFVVLRPTIAAWQEAGTWPLVAVAVVGFGAVCLSVWGWRRFVQSD